MSSTFAGTPMPVRSICAKITVVQVTKYDLSSTPCLRTALLDMLEQSRDYDRLQQLMFEALHYFAILARHGQINRHDTLGAR